MTKRETIKQLRNAIKIAQNTIQQLENIYNSTNQPPQQIAELIDELKNYINIFNQQLIDLGAKPKKSKIPERKILKPWTAPDLSFTTWYDYIKRYRQLLIRNPNGEIMEISASTWDFIVRREIDAALAAGETLLWLMLKLKGWYMVTW